MDEPAWASARLGVGEQHRRRDDDRFVRCRRVDRPAGSSAAWHATGARPGFVVARQQPVRLRSTRLRRAPPSVLASRRRARATKIGSATGSLGPSIVRAAEAVADPRTITRHQGPGGDRRPHGRRTMRLQRAGLSDGIHGRGLVGRQHQPGCVLARHGRNWRLELHRPALANGAKSYTTYAAKAGPGARYVYASTSWDWKWAWESVHYVFQAWDSVEISPGNWHWYLAYCVVSYDA